MDAMNESYLAIDESTWITTDENAYKIRVLDDAFNPSTDLAVGFAFVPANGRDVYYLYMGEIGPEDNPTEHGIYRISSNSLEDPNEKQYTFKCIDGEYADTFTYKDKIAHTQVKKIVEIANSNREIFIAVADTDKVFIPDENVDDDMLKKIVKRILADKNINLDNYKHRFSDRNSLSNLKSSIRRDGQKLSIMLFERFIDALNLKFVIHVVEKDDGSAIIGRPLSKTIEYDSDETL